MITFLAVMAGLGSLLGTLVLVFGLATSSGAPQEAAVAGIALALAVLPYVLLRAVQLAQSAELQREILRRLPRSPESISKDAPKQ